MEYRDTSKGDVLIDCYLELPDGQLNKTQITTYRPHCRGWALESKKYPYRVILTDPYLFSTDTIGSTACVPISKHTERLKDPKDYQWDGTYCTDFMAYTTSEQKINVFGGETANVLYLIENTTIDKDKR